ncbi:UDP-N-acetylmuramoyl-tripeptide--D-alanyl-D-alanine ligase [Seongchinamella sediminis]|uniref:UDP-N-acetylmuramoyl-tripeptide--D-alanyl-D-alanine ligase n=2 Tax=Seongchinamella sediminis TaxID=2283635 RepID=A0A3L7E1W2_9GAMM|nr:UDP-N-acetylmuramoyl-tripeptide--D-alanyl-D-alanine ligase [Seongchinamella sediminis]
MSLAELQQPLAGQLLAADASFSTVFTDSRQVVAGGLFVALVGEHFDGNDYIAEVGAAGAAAALVSRAADTGLPQLLVADTQQALGRLGACNRDLYQGPLVAITGSCGKTTAKNLINGVLSRRGNTLATAGNFNNEIGVPLTLLRLAPEHEFAVVEMGAGKPGDIAWLCELGRPNVSVLLNALPAHLEGLGSLEGVARTKGEIFDALGAGDTAIINADQQWAGDWRQRAGAATVLDFSVAGQPEAAIAATGFTAQGAAGSRFSARTPAGPIEVRLQLPGEHNVANALAAIAVGLACGLELAEISAGLASVAPVAGRLSTVPAPSGALVIDDCYNANPGSARAAIDTLVASEGRSALLMGAMRELGADSAELHRELGEYAKAAGVEQFWGVGDELREAVSAFGEKGRWFADCEQAALAAADAFGAGDTILIKGSRGARMERVLQALVPKGPGGES